MKRIQLSIDKIEQHEACQQRTLYDAAVIDDYAEHLENGGTFPPLTVFCANGVYVLGDGHLRLRAYQRYGVKTVEVDVIGGNLRDAILFSCGANAGHGAKRTSADVRKAIKRMLNDPEWKQWSVKDIAKACKVSRSTVERVSEEMKEEAKPAADSDGEPSQRQKWLPELTTPEEKADFAKYAQNASENLGIAERNGWAPLEKSAAKQLDLCGTALGAES